MANVVRRKEPALEWDPFRLMREMMSWDPFQEMAPYASTGGTTFVPQFEVRESRDQWVFKADMPGVKEADLDIALTGNRLTVSGKRDAEKRDEGDRYYTYERSYGAFSRTFTLPEGADAEHVRAELKQGVLTLVLPKRPELQPRRIEVKGIADPEQPKH